MTLAHRPIRSGTIASIAIALTSLAARGDAPPPSGYPQITTAQALGTSLLIGGKNFGTNPQVTLGDSALSVISSSPSAIEAVLPAGFAPASYSLWVKSTVTTAAGPVPLWSFLAVTLGAVGPQGPKGDQGLKGDKGDQGPPGTFTGHFRSPSGLFMLDVDDTGIQLSGPGGTVTISSLDVTVSAISTKVKSSQSMLIDSGGDTNVKSAGNTQIESSHDIRIKSGGNTQIDGTEVDVGTSTSAAQVNLNAANVDVNAMQVDVNGTSSVAITGGLVQIN